MSHPASMSQVFLSKLEDVLEKNYQNEHFGVKELAVALGVSRSKLHRKLNQIKGQTTSEFIKQFRLQKAYVLLKNEVATVSEIAYAVGFNSPSYFTKCFHEHYNIAPGEVKNKTEDLSEVHKPKSYSSFKIKKGTIVIASFVLIALIGFVLFFSSAVKNEKNKTYSIAVLPFKNLSSDESNQYFADGVMDVILSKLSSIEGFRVISRTTMEQYRETTKPIPEIGRELDVAYVLEASLQKNDNDIRIVTQLIDAKNDDHLWTKNYVRQFDDIFALQSDIAKDVAKNLKATISPSDLKKIEYRSTENFQAYNLYLKGRFFWHKRTEPNLKKSVAYFEKAIEKDSNYALAYAGLADAYFIMAWWRWVDKDDGFKKAKTYAQEALSIKSTASAYATIGAVSCWYDWNWKQSEKELNQAIALDPNYATAHQYYAELLDILGRNDEARQQINLAIKFNPNSFIAEIISGMIFYNNKEFENAIIASDKASEIKGVKRDAVYLKSYIRLGENKKALQHLKSMLSDSVNNTSEIDEVFKKLGIKRTVNYYIDKVWFDKREYYYKKATLYCLVGNTEKALDYLDKSYASGEPILPRINNNIDFNPIRTDPRFIALLGKMNLK